MTQEEKEAGAASGRNSIERDPSKRYNIQAVDRAIKLLELLSENEIMKLDGLSEKLEVSTSTTYRLLSTLQSHRYIQKDEQRGGYRLGLACLELARSFAGTSDIRRAALPDLDRLRDETKETVHLAVLDAMEVVYLDKRHGLHPIGLMSSRVGGRSPAYCTGLGKVLLAFEDPPDVDAHFRTGGLHRFTERTLTDVDDLLDHLEAVRDRGYALDLGEHEPEVRCVAAPVFDGSGDVVAAISISGPASRLGELDDHRELIERTRRAAEAVSAKLGYPTAQK